MKHCLTRSRLSGVISAMAVVVAATLIAPQSARAQGPSFDCAKVPPGGIARMVCDDEALSALDRKLADVYGAAAKKAANEHPPTLRVEQNGWIRGRDDCWKADDKRACVAGEYTRRIAALQARYRLVPGRGPVAWLCEGDRRNEIVTTFFATEPPTLIAERGDSVSLMYREGAGPDSRFVGRNESLKERGDGISVVWGYGATELHCVKAP